MHHHNQGDEGEEDGEKGTSGLVSAQSTLTVKGT